MRIRVRFFAVLRERTGTDARTIELSIDSTVAIALAQLTEESPSLADALSHVATAVNREYVNRDFILHDGDELALIPAVSGG